MNARGILDYSVTEMTRMPEGPHPAPRATFSRNAIAKREKGAGVTSA
jgi:hypothetical protein